jgi:signal transduction histidine kinase
MTPFGDMMSGVEIHAHAFETLRRGRFVREASPLAQAGLAVLIAMAAGLIFFFLSGWPAYGLGLLLIALSQVIPHIAMHLGFVVPYATPMLVSWLTTASAATWMYFGTRRELRRTEADKARYRQAIHFVTHEMRSPLTAIQGSSELMGRYNLNEDKRKQMAQMINSESKRLARMIQTFLDIERLSDGSMDFRKERVSIIDLVNACVERAQPLAERKQIRVLNQVRDSLELSGDRELLEYAVYNLITNAIKYSPDETTVTLSTTTQDHVLRLHVADQGIGIEQKDLPQIFKKFYRTKKAETSGEVGTGIGLSIVEQIVQHHQGRIEVTSTPGKGSCFTMVLPRAQAPERTPASSTVSNS